MKPRLRKVWADAAEHLRVRERQQERTMKLNEKAIANMAFDAMLMNRTVLTDLAQRTTSAYQPLAVWLITEGEVPLAYGATKQRFVRDVVATTVDLMLGMVYSEQFEDEFHRRASRYFDLAESSFDFRSFSTSQRRVCNRADDAFFRRASRFLTMAGIPGDFRSFADIRRHVHGEPLWKTLQYAAVPAWFNWVSSGRALGDGKPLELGVDHGPWDLSISQSLTFLARHGKTRTVDPVEALRAIAQWTVHADLRGDEPEPDYRSLLGVNSFPVSDPSVIHELAAAFPYYAGEMGRTPTPLPEESRQSCKDAWVDSALQFLGSDLSNLDVLSDFALLWRPASAIEKAFIERALMSRLDLCEPVAVDPDDPYGARIPLWMAHFGIKTPTRRPSYAQLRDYVANMSR
jgi:hypothetical protein